MSPIVAFALALPVACTGDPDLRAQARSLEAWEAGKVALEAGDPAAARDRFREAQQAWPSPLLGAWEARALAATGRPDDLQAAVDRLQAVLAAHPTFAEARYNRAAYLLRLDAQAPAPGRVDRAAAELEQALADGDHLSPRSVLDDPDFAAVLDHPAFAFLPQAALSLAVDPPPETAFWGAEVALRARLLGAVELPISAEAAVAEGPLELVSVIEDAVATTDGEGREITWTWRVIGAGKAVIGPLTVRAGAGSATAGAVEIVTAAPPDRSAPSRALTLPVPSRVAAALSPRTPAVVGGVLVVRAHPGDRVERDPPGEPPARLEVRSRGVAADVVWRWPSATAADRVRIRDGSGVEVFSGPVPAH